MTNSAIANLAAAKLSAGLIEVKVRELAPAKKGYEHVQKFVISFKVGQAWIDRYMTDAQNIYEIDPQFGNPRKYKNLGLISKFEFPAT